MKRMELFFLSFFTGKGRMDFTQVYVNSQLEIELKECYSLLGTKC